MAADKFSFHMTPDDFRKHGYKVIDWIADYYENVEKYPVLSNVKPGDIRKSLPDSPPQKGESYGSNDVSRREGEAPPR